MITIDEKVGLLSDYNLCDHCFGRQFARLGRGLTNFERTWIIQSFKEKEEEISEEMFVRENIPNGREKKVTEDCQICGGRFNNLDEYVDIVKSSLERYSFKTYLVGTRVPSEVGDAEEEIWENVGVQWVEPIKSEFNRIIGKRLEKRLKEDEGLETDVDFKRPDVNPVIDLSKGRAEVQINSMLIHGFYNKLVRGIPQTEWTCGKCKGKGCDECDWTGKNYEESVQEIIAEPLIKETKGLETKFHGAGREDVDAKCLGNREFVIEVLEPEKRNVDLEKLAEEVNSSGKIEVSSLSFAEKDLVEKVKKRRANKTYRALVSLEEPVEDERFERLNKLIGTVDQKTPTRVEHRRANKTRKRKVFAVSWDNITDESFELTVKGEAGLYIKELISGDKNKTKPSVSDILGTETVCKELDVIGIEKPEGFEDV